MQLVITLSNCVLRRSISESAWNNLLLLHIFSCFVPVCNLNPFFFSPAYTPYVFALIKHICGCLVTLQVLQVKDLRMFSQCGPHFSCTSGCRFCVFCFWLHVQPFCFINTSAVAQKENKYFRSILCLQTQFNS